MSDLFAVANRRNSSRACARTMMTGAVLVVFAMSLSSINVIRTPQDNAAHRPILLRLIDAATPAPPPSPVYDEEHQMSSAQLLNRWDGFVTEASQRFHVPKPWIRAVMRQETGGRTVLAQDQPIVSSAGAQGLMQLMPETYEEMARAHKLGTDPFDPRANIMAGAAYLRWLHAHYGYPKMFAAYNAGPGRVDHGGRLPAETRAYVVGVTATVRAAKAAGDKVNLTRPDGGTVQIAANKVTAVRVPAPGEYPRNVRALVSFGHKTQAVRENVQLATAAISAAGGVI